MIDQDKIEQAVRLLLEGIGEDVEREGLKDTPNRIARMYEEIYGGMYEDAGEHLAKTFSVDSSEMVIEKDITFYSTCERKSGGTEQAGEDCGSIRAEAPDPGAADRTDRGRSDGAYAAEGSDGHDRGGAHVHDDARDQEAGQSDCDAGEKRRVRDGSGAGRAVFPHDGKAELMDRVNAIWKHPVYQEYYRRLEKLEEERSFCRHQMPHLLDVARIARIRSLEDGLELDTEVIYAAAILHDIGKSLQYEEKIPHETAGVRIAGEILDSLPEEDAFTEEEKKMILTAIQGHRRLRRDPEPLERLLYESDKASRMCLACPAEGLCDWSEEKKNMEIKV